MKKTVSLSQKLASSSLGENLQKPGDAHVRPVEKSTGPVGGPGVVANTAPAIEPVSHGGLSTHTNACSDHHDITP